MKFAIAILTFCLILALGIFKIRSSIIQPGPTTTNSFPIPEPLPSESEPTFIVETFPGKSVSGGVKYLVDELGVEFIIPPQIEYETLYIGNAKYPLNTYPSRLCISSHTEPLKFFTTCHTDGFALTALSSSGGHFEREEKRLDDMKSYILQNGKYFGRYDQDKFIEIVPKKIIEIVNQHGVTILRLVGKDMTITIRNTTRLANGTPGEGYVGAIINLPNNPIYSGFTIKMRLTDTLTEQVFDQILDSIRVIR